MTCCGGGSRSRGRASCHDHWQNRWSAVETKQNCLKLVLRTAEDCFIHVGSFEKYTAVSRFLTSDVLKFFLIILIPYRLALICQKR